MFSDAVRVQVAHIRQEAERVRSLMLVPETKGVLPAAPPGSHIDVHLPNGLTRQYSILNGPDDKQYYQIAVKLGADSRGGSSSIWSLEEGQVLSIGKPRNAFPIASSASEHILVAAGIGITPLLSMARHLSHRNYRYHLRYYGRAVNEMPFLTEIGSSNLLENSRVCAGLRRAAIASDLAGLLAMPVDRRHLYVCGPPSFMEVTRATATQLGWAPEQIHSESFVRPSAEPNGTKPLTVYLARSEKLLQVSENQSILDAVRAAGIRHGSSCELGVCGSCVAEVLEGMPDHRDQFLDDDEKKSGRAILICVSRAIGTHLTLDL